MPSQMPQRLTTLIFNRSNSNIRINRMKPNALACPSCWNGAAANLFICRIWSGSPLVYALNISPVATKHIKNARKSSLRLVAAFNYQHRPTAQQKRCSYARTIIPTLRPYQLHCRLSLVPQRRQGSQVVILTRDFTVPRPSTPSHSYTPSSYSSSSYSPGSTYTSPSSSSASTSRWGSSYKPSYLGRY